MNFSNLILPMLLLMVFASPISEPGQPVHDKAPVPVARVFQSSDAGQSWQDISDGLPQTWQADNVEPDGVFANEAGLFIRAGNEIFRNKKTTSDPFWEKEHLPTRSAHIAPGTDRMFAYNKEGQFMQKINGTGIWSPVFNSVRQIPLSGIFETASGTVLVGSYDALYRSGDRGKTWKILSAAVSLTNMVESKGVILATSRSGIMRSINGGESWDQVLYSGGVGIDVERIDGGVAAIVYDTKAQARIISATYDGGNTWRRIDVGLRPDPRTASIVQLGGSFYCGHPDGVFKSSDQGKTWKLVFPSVSDLVYNLFVSGNMLYAIPRPGGC